MGTRIMRDSVALAESEALAESVAVAGPMAWRSLVFTVSQSRSSSHRTPQLSDS
jgi:hypothetical protein